MRIGIFTDTYTPDINGVVSSIVTLRKALMQAGHTVFVIANHPDKNISMEDNVLRLPGVELKKLYGYTMSSPIQIKADEYIQDMDLDIVHIQGEFGVAFYGRQIAKDLGLPVVYTYHTMYEDYTHYVNPLDFATVEQMARWGVRRLTRIGTTNVQGVIAPSQKTKEALLSYGVKAPIYVVPSGLDLERFQPDKVDPEKVKAVRGQFDDDLHLVLFVGRLAKEKALDMLIKGISLSKDPRLHLVVVGSGTDEDWFKEQAQMYGVKERVHFMGKVPAEEVPAWYNAFDAFASASLSETQGLTYLEALASGLPVFGRRDEVLDGLIDEGVTGGYFDSAEEAAKKWDAFFAQSPEERLAHKDACRQKTAPLSASLFGAKVLSVYNQAIDDYKRTFTIEKVKMLDDFMLLTMSRKQDEEPIKLLMPFDDFYELKIVAGTRLDATLVAFYLGEQNYYSAVMRAKERLAHRDSSRYEMENWLIRRCDLPQEQAVALSHEFVERGLINDRTYAQDKAEYWHGMGYSRSEIRRKLYKAGIRGELAEEAVSRLGDELELANALKAGKQMARSLHQQSRRLRRQTLQARLSAKGYTHEIADKVYDSLELELDNEEDEQEALLINLRKANRMYASLPEERREQKIRQYCLRKGFSSSLIQEAMEDFKNED